ncbi:hypothetical protein EVAR_91989_1 [Eumeta japonica]|uniref:Uncharacterized protein n=1 Tax=Eumeta variegata TaxID=151549 RepID=A0A4C2AF28_EUMVA|nr:hypothetical protein EVAR_91989_1 [Eumeta japonica]
MNNIRNEINKEAETLGRGERRRHPPAARRGVNTPAYINRATLRVRPVRSGRRGSNKKRKQPAAVLSSTTTTAFQSEPNVEEHRPTIAENIKPGRQN